MPKVFTEQEVVEISRRFTDFKREHPEFDYDITEYVKDFREIVSESDFDGTSPHKPKSELHIKEMVKDDKVLAKYNTFYKDKLKEQFKKIGEGFIREKESPNIKEESFTAYENFMRGMFKDFVAPCINQEVSLKDYRFGCMKSKDLEEVSSLFDRYTQEWSYRNDIRYDSHKGGMNFKEDLNNYMDVYPVSSNLVNKEERASDAAVMYKCLSDKYNSRSRFAKIFFPNAWFESRALSRAESYIQSLRDDVAKNEVSFQDYVRECASSPAVPMQEFQNLVNSINYMMEDSKELDKQNPENDVLNEEKGDLAEELYGKEDSLDNENPVLNDNKNENLIIDMEEKEEEVNQDFVENDSLKNEEEIDLSEVPDVNSRM